MLAMPNSCMSDEASVSSDTKAPDYSGALSPLFAPISPLRHQQPSQTNSKKKRSQPGNPDPDAEVVALSPKSLMATNRFVCEVCNKGFQRDQNLQLHRRGHNLPWKLRQRSSREVVKRRVYVCPVVTCVHHQPSRALGDLTGIKKHYSRKHGEKKWKCDKCSKRYAVHSDWKAHVKTCGTREYRCDCGTLFSRKDSFITHRAFCDALAQESARLIAAAAISNTTTTSMTPHQLPPPLYLPFSSMPARNPNPNPNASPSLFLMKPSDQLFSLVEQRHPQAELNATSSSPNLSATALLQTAAAMGVMPITHTDGYDASCMGFDVSDIHAWQDGNRLTRDFLGVVDDANASAEGELLPLVDVVSRGDPPGPITAFQFPTVMERWGSHC